MNGLALCAGTGGLELGIKIVVPRYRAVCYVERDAYAAATLVARMADAALDPAPVWDDVATFDGRPWRGVVDIITAGYPCQPFSHAGKRLGIADPRHLWPYIARIIREVAPSLVFLENVPGHLNLGFREVVDELESMDYRVAVGLFSAAEVGAPHLRKRLFALANAQGNRQPGIRIPEGSGGEGEGTPYPLWTSQAMANTDSQGLAIPEFLAFSGAPGDGEGNLPAAQQLCCTPFPPGPDDLGTWQRIPNHLQPAIKPNVRGVADGTSRRVDRLRAAGNGVVPLVAAYAFASLMSISRR